MKYLLEIESLLRQKIGLDPTILGRNTLQKVIEKRQKKIEVKDGESYLNILKNSLAEFEDLIEEIVVPETWFFRDSQPFAYLKNHVFSSKQSQFIAQPVKILSVPSSSGEEAYSIAITLLETGLTPSHFIIEAVDISKKAIAKAQRAIYTKNSFRGEDFVNREKYFQQIGEQYQLSQQVRQTVNFSQGNLLNILDSPRKYDIIFCRNVLIYLDSVICDQVMRGLERLLTPGGILFVGSAETGKVPLDKFVSLRQPFTFAYQKITPKEIETRTKPPKNQQQETLRKPPVIIKSTNLQPSVKASLDEARRLADQGKLTEAISLSQVYLKENSLSGEGYLLLGELYQAIKNDQEAEQCFKKALYLNPNNYQALTHLLLLKKYQGALTDVNVLKKRLERLTHS